ncbi:MAG: RsmD family RNA methyltransferase [Holophagaceae bacterium]|nr:RsmD family RNA methyltransferase [Holophagaceae bacterium]
MRIIAGANKGRRLAKLGPECRHIRPTSDMAREALFSILERWPKGPFLDIFSGTGAVALEALSRAYCPVWCIENDKTALALIKKNTHDTELNTIEKDACKLRHGDFSGLSVIFADPPYDKSLALWDILAERLTSYLSPAGIIVWECQKATTLPKPSGISIVDERNYGDAKFVFFASAPIS